MSTLAGNPHYNVANDGNYTELDAYCQSQAILALAHEQRLANLIAWHAVVDSEDPVCEELYSAIYNGLGLKSL